jgi:YafQ family addiction module toxin component
MLKFSIKPSLLKKLNKIKKRDKKSYENILKKINEIMNSSDIEHYKNLRKPMQDIKRVHLNTHFVLLFKYKKSEKELEFLDYLHHDEAYL